MPPVSRGYRFLFLCPMLCTCATCEGDNTKSGWLTVPGPSTPPPLPPVPHGGQFRYVTPPPLPALRAHLVTKDQWLWAIHRVAPNAPENSVPFAVDPQECRGHVGLPGPTTFQTCCWDEHCPRYLGPLSMFCALCELPEVGHRRIKEKTYCCTHNHGNNMQPAHTMQPGPTYIATNEQNIVPPHPSNYIVLMAQSDITLGQTCLHKQTLGVQKTGRQGPMWKMCVKSGQWGTRMVHMILELQDSSERDRQRGRKRSGREQEREEQNTQQTDRGEVSPCTAAAQLRLT